MFRFESRKITLNLLIKRTFYEQRNSRILLRILEFLRAFLFINSRNSRILLGILEFLLRIRWLGGGIFSLGILDFC